MPAVHEVLGDTAWLVARVAQVATNTDSTSPETSAADNNDDDDRNNRDNNSSSPLLFFVALGFGVVFTNLWYALLEPLGFDYGGQERMLTQMPGSSSASSTASATMPATVPYAMARMASPSTWRTCLGRIAVAVRRSS
jgi:hypothetical protein